YCTRAVGAHLNTPTGARAVPARSTPLGRGGPEHSGAFPPAMLLRTGTVRGPAVAALERIQSIAAAVEAMRRNSIYSWRKASIGSSLAARKAGYQPKTIP